ncbi:phage tail tape measure protein, partial [Rhodococcus sp. 05-2255-3C]
MTQAKAFAGAMGLALGGAAVAAGVKEIITIGNDYTTTMNTLQAVTRATESQMSAAGDRAKALGNDISLPGTSASDAAAAMTELAKGGFSVQQSMDAAKGTLQLAAAAQIDAASAATIQSQALQSFGLNADYAATVSDVLANSANASSAEITDVAMGLAQSGAVANQFGMSIEDTAATLGVLANAGIQGSDAGTLLKSTLLALTDQSNPAQGAIEDLGLTVYNAQGQFVGMSELFRQLDEAAASMSPELYQAATATLFGSDAMRLAGVAAEQGQAGYDSMRTAVERQGAAAEVAAAKTKGLPGAMASAGNAAETLALGVYDLVDGPLEDLITKGAEFVTNTTPGLISGLESAGQAMAPVAGFVGDLVSAFADLPAPVQATALALGAIKISGLDDSIGATIDGWRESMSGFRADMEMQSALAGISDSDTANPFAGLTGDAEDLAGALEENAEPISELAAGLATLERRSPAVRNMAEGYRGVTARTREFANQQRAAAGQSGALTSVLRNATARAAQFGGVVGGAAVAGVRGLRSAASGAIGMLGGPWVVGLMAASFAVSAFTEKSRKMSTIQDSVTNSSKALADSQADVEKAFISSGGAMSADVSAGIGAQIDTLVNGQRDIADAALGYKDLFVSGVGDVGSFLLGDFDLSATRATDSAKRLSEEAQRVTASFDGLGMSNQQITERVSGTDSQFTELTDGLREMGPDAEGALRKVEDLRRVFETAQATASVLTPGVVDLAGAYTTLADSSGSAEDRLNALKTIMDVLSGAQIPLSEATANYNKTINEIVASTVEMADATKGLGDQLISADGSVNTLTENGGALQDSLSSIRDESARVAEQAFQTAIAQGQTLPEAMQASRDAMARNGEALGPLGDKYKLTGDQIATMAERAGLVPDTIVTAIALQGADATATQLATVATAMDAARNGGKPLDIVIKAPTGEARQNLEELGYSLNDVVGKPGVVSVTAPNEFALAQLDAVINKLISTGEITATPKLDLNTVELTVGHDQAMAILGQIDRSTASPDVNLILDKLMAGSDVTLAELRKIQESNPSPEVTLAVAEALESARVVQEAIDKAARDREARIKYTITEYKDVVENFRNSGPIPGVPVAGPVSMERPPGRATGGALVGPGTSTSDSMLMYTPGFGAWRGSTGEHVLDAGDVQAMGGQENVYRFRQMLDM